jgi:hypothetical protein
MDKTHKHLAAQAAHHSRMSKMLKVSHPQLSDEHAEMCKSILALYDEVPEQHSGSTVPTGTEFHGAVDAEDLLKSFTG